MMVDKCLNCEKQVFQLSNVCTEYYDPYPELFLNCLPHALSFHVSCMSIERDLQVHPRHNLSESAVYLKLKIFPWSMGNNL